MYIMHDLYLLSRCGPLITHWCMRYEAKHSFFKHLANIVRNFKNIPKTLAARHPHYMCYQMLESEKYLRHQDTCTGSQCTYIQVQVALFILLTASSISIEDFEFSEEITHSLPELSLDTKLWRLEMLNHKLL